MSDDGLFGWALTWARRVVALALLAGTTAAVVGTGVFAVGSLVGPDSPTDDVTAVDAPSSGSTTAASDADEGDAGGTPTATGEPPRVVVDVEAVGLADAEKYERTVVRAVRYWRTHADQAGYAVRPTVNASATAPDVTVRVMSNVTCEGDPSAVGCAPLLSDAGAFEDTVEVRLEPRPNDRLTYRIAVHELGHVFGVEHCTEPRAFLDTDCPAEVRAGDRPDADERDSPWRPLPWAETDDADVRELRVYVDTSGWVPGTRAVAVTQVRRALDYYNRVSGPDNVGTVRFTEVDDPYRADVRIGFSRETTLCVLSNLCSEYRGVNTDADDDLELYSYARLEVALTTPELVGWRVGYQLGRLLGADETALPPAFRDRRAVNITGQWWTYEPDDDRSSGGEPSNGAGETITPWSPGVSASTARSTRHPDPP